MKMMTMTPGTRPMLARTEGRDRMPSETVSATKMMAARLMLMC